MLEHTWSPAEKKLAREVFNRCAEIEEKELLDRLKAKAKAARSNDLFEWVKFAKEIEHLDREYQQKYDYR